MRVFGSVPIAWCAAGVRVRGARCGPLAPQPWSQSASNSASDSIDSLTVLESSMVSARFSAFTG